jgi:DNA-binding NtrC family response regulator
MVDENDDILITESFHEAQKKNVEKFQKNYLKNLLMVFKGNISKASEFAKADRRGLYRLIKKYNIKPDIYRSGASVSLILLLLSNMSVSLFI